jgi:hypothetical protein
MSVIQDAPHVATLEICVMCLGNKDIYYTSKTCCSVSVLFPAEFH